jgi:hypothetical protein
MQIRKHKGSWTDVDSTPNAYQEPLPQAKHPESILRPGKSQVTTSHKSASLKSVVLA